jgi:hypothetical protein
MKIIDPRIHPDLLPEGGMAKIVNSKDSVYLDLPSVIVPNPAIPSTFMLISRWEPTDEERRKILAGEDVYVTITTTGPINPFLVSTGPLNWKAGIR